MCLYIESLHDLWLERCRIVYESMASKIKIKDHYNLLVQVSKLFTQVEINASSMLLQYKHRLNSLPTEKLRGVAYQLLSNLNVDSHQTPFHNDILRNKISTQRELTPEIIQRRDQATMRCYQQSGTRKRRREEFKDMVESRLHRKCKNQEASLSATPSSSSTCMNAALLAVPSTFRTCILCFFNRQQKQYILGKYTDNISTWSSEAYIQRV